MTQCTDIPTRVRAIEGDPRLSRRVVERFNRLPYRPVVTVREAVVVYGLNTVEAMVRRCREPGKRPDVFKRLRAEVRLRGSGPSPPDV